MKNNVKQKKRCPRQGCENDATIDPIYGVLPCITHQMESVKISSYEFATQSQADRVRHERDEFGADLLQPWESDGKTVNKEFVYHYPDKVGDYFTESELKDI